VARWTNIRRDGKEDNNPMDTEQDGRRGFVHVAVSTRAFKKTTRNTISVCFTGQMIESIRTNGKIRSNTETTNIRLKRLC
jgi:hypothetical protein